MWILRLLRTLSRNQLALLPRADRGKRAVSRYLEQAGYGRHRISATLGLAEADQLAVTVVFPTDTMLAEFSASAHPARAKALLLDALGNAGYPVAPGESVLSFHSEEAIRRSGGEHYYFK